VPHAICLSVGNADRYDSLCHMARTKADRYHRIAGHQKCRRVFPDLPEQCEWPGCDSPPKDRHHKDDNPHNNVRENIEFLCRRHHMEADGRLEAAKETMRQNAASKRKDPVPCVVCSRVVKVTRKGRCGACGEFFRRNGVERYEDGVFAGVATGMGAATPRLLPD
jgi:hypothetical protein